MWSNFPRGVAFPTRLCWNHRLATCCRKPRAGVVKSQGAVVETEPIVMWKRSERLTERRKKRHLCGHKGTLNRPTGMDLHSRRERGWALFGGDPRRPLGKIRNTKS